MLNELTSAQAISIEAHRSKQHQHIVESALQKFIGLLTVGKKHRRKNSMSRMLARMNHTI